MSSEEAVMKDRSAVLTIIALLVALGCAGLLLSKVQKEFEGPGHFAAYEIIWWTLVVLLLSYIRLVERRPLTSIGFRIPGTRNVVIGIAAGIVIFAGLAGLYLVILPALHFKEDPQVTQVMTLMLAKPLWWRLTLILRGTIAEEIIFRGYAIERIQGLAGNVRVAGTVSCIIFALEHLGAWSWGHVVIAGFAGATLTLLYIWRRNLWVNMIAHFVPDAVGLLFG